MRPGSLSALMSKRTKKATIRFASLTSHCHTLRKNSDSPTNKKRYSGSRDEVRDRDWFN